MSEVESAVTPPPAQAPDVLLVTGLSGAGSSTVANLLEDAGWYVADNVPHTLIGSMVELASGADSAISRLAIVMRIQDNSYASVLETLRADLDRVGIEPRVVFIEASDQVLVQRFEQVRRRHPLQGTGTLISAIVTERAMLAAVKERADLVIDTSGLSVQRLRVIIEGAYAEASVADVSVVVESFGFKYGLPIDADMVADVRFLPNPYWVPELKDHSGLEQPVRDYVLGQEGAPEFLEKYEQILRLVGAGYRREGKRYMTVAIGCTGGKHRSVAITEALAASLSKATDAEGAFSVRVAHRDLGRE
ncbi:RNase adapter RapZ [Williamsia sp.]|uniref:RNase adapter RapZ n=1 Tax=Williamsia sp. TaxID=1872085 RepID=UPI002F9445A1